MTNKLFTIFTLITLSAVIFALSLIYPAKLYFLVFIFLVPINYLAIKLPSCLSFKHGFLWGLIFFSIHFFGYIFMFYSQTNGCFRIFIPIILASYCALYSGAWFFFASITSKYFKYKISAISCCWVIFTYLYFSWIKYGVFWIFGKFFGYPFSYPLLPLVAKTQLLYFMPYFGKSVLLGFVILFSQFIAIFLVYFKSKHVFFAFIFLSPFILGQFFYKSKNIIEQNISTIGYISPISAQALLNPIDQAQEVYYQMVKLLDNNSKIRTIFMPESSCQFCLNKNKYIIDLWASNILGDNIDLLIGAPYMQGDKVYNCLYYISQGKIKKIYKKTHLMPFAEYTPKFWNNFECIKKLFFQDYKLSCGCDKKILLKCCKNIIFRPLICSDFFTIKKRETISFFDFSHFTLLLPVNDSIFFMQYLRDLVMLYVKMEAIRLKRDILYVGYYFACFVLKNGDYIFI